MGDIYLVKQSVTGTNGVCLRNVKQVVIIAYFDCYRRCQFCHNQEMPSAVFHLKAGNSTRQSRR